MMKSIDGRARVSAVSVVAMLVSLSVMPQAQAQDRPLCVEQACLGMTLTEAAALPLTPARFGFKLDDQRSGSYGLDGSGQRVNLADQGEVDRELIGQFDARVKTICRFGAATARLQVGDVQHTLLFSPAIRNGKGALILTEIARPLPRQVSDAEVQRAVAQARAQYGKAYAEPWTPTVTRPTVSLYDQMIMARSLVLRLPVEDVAARLLAQPGCGGK